MSFYGLVVIFVLLFVTVYLCAFCSEMRYEGSVNLAFDRLSSAINTLSYLGVVNSAGGGQAYVNYTLTADGMAADAR